MPVTEICSKLHVIKTMATGMEASLMSPVIKKIDATKHKNNISEHIMEVLQDIYVAVKDLGEGGN
jgi:hypothetical protein